mmetsp:Transcript_1932/g.2774  ORF Transcript_1932/g.2774 Transcript_1932/m.2774 type:complete len:127 (-) Transcript_1932:3453-3833(-)
MAFGLFEFFFNKISKFIYVHREEEQEIPGRGPCFFIRKVRWARFLKNLGDEQTIVREQFTTKVLLDYLEKVYLPIKQDKQLQIQTILYQREKAIRQIRRQKRISNDLSIQSTNNNMKKRREMDLDY